MKKNLTGLLLVFIGLIISLFIGFGFILTLVGLFMIADVNEDFKKARNMFIGSLIASVVGFFIIIGMGGANAIMIASNNTNIAGIIGLIIVTIAVIIALYIFNVKAYGSLLAGCDSLALEKKEVELSQKCRRASLMYRNSLLTTTIVGILTMLFIWVPVLNVILIIASICAGVWYFVSQIFVIIRVWQTYDKCKEVGR